MVIGFAGSREGITYQQNAAVNRLLVRFHVGLVVHGGCVGADEWFHQLCGVVCDRRVYPASNVPKQFVSHKVMANAEQVMNPTPAPGRNLLIIRDMHVGIACPAEMMMPADPRGKGTWHFVRHTREAGKPLFLILPNGIVQEERCGELLTSRRT